MKVSKWGNSLAIRLPAELVAAKRIKEGDELDGHFWKKVQMSDEERLARIADAWKEFEKVSHHFKWPEGYKFDRDEANSRD